MKKILSLILMASVLCVSLQMSVFATDAYKNTGSRLYMENGRPMIQLEYGSAMLDYWSKNPVDENKYMAGIGYGDANWGEDGIFMSVMDDAAYPFDVAAMIEDDFPILDLEPAEGANKYYIDLYYSYGFDGEYVDDYCGKKIIMELSNPERITSPRHYMKLLNARLEDENTFYMLFEITDTPWQGFDDYTDIEEYYEPVEYKEPEEYLYDIPDEGDSVDVSDRLDDISDKQTAEQVIKDTAAVLDEIQKEAPTGIDKMTVLAEAAIQKVACTEIDSDVLHITEPIVKDLEPAAVELAEVLDEALSQSGVETQRIMSKTVSVKTPQRGALNVKKDVASTAVDNVRVQTDYAAVSIAAEDSAEFTMESAGQNALAINFTSDDTTTLKISFPGDWGNSDFMAIVDENGNAVGGKYNPATGEIEARITESGVYSVQYNEKDFSDIKDKAYEMQLAIKTLAAKGIINGTSPETFSPDNTISRAEIAALIVRTLSKLNPNEDGGFADVSASDWYFGAAGSSKKYGIINGYDDNTFRGTAVIAKDQIVVVTARVLKKEMNYKEPDDINMYLYYEDADALAEWSKPEIALANMARLTIERMDNMFIPSAEMTRGDASIILMRLFNKIW